MKNNLFILMISFLIASCSTSNTHPDYKANLATAKKLFALHAEENYDEQVKLVSKDIVSQPAIYGVDQINYEGYCQMIKGYHAAFDDIKYTADYWLPGTDTLGNVDGSVRTYGTWTGVHTATQKPLSLKGYWYMNFDNNGKIVAQGDFFDFGGMLDAVYPKNLIFADLKVKEGKKQALLDILVSEGGLPTTRKADGCLGYEMAYNEESRTFHLVGEWESYEKYAVYSKWRQTEDTLISYMLPLLDGGEKGFSLSTNNTDYISF